MRKYAMLLPVCIAAAVFLAVAAYGQRRRPAAGQGIAEKVDNLERQVITLQEETNKKLALLKEDVGKIDRQIKQLIIYQSDAAKHKIRFEIKASPLSDEVRNRYDIEKGQGVRLTKTSPELEKAGLKKGCAVIALNGTPVKHDTKDQISPNPTSLRMLPGDIVTFTIINSIGKHNVDVVLPCIVCRDTGKCPMQASNGKSRKKSTEGLTEAQIARCMSNLQQIFKACVIYSMDPENKIFPFMEEDSKAHEHLQLLASVVDDPKIFICPGSVETPAQKDRDGNFMLSTNTCSFAYSKNPRNTASKGSFPLVATKRIITGPKGRGIIVLRISGQVEWVAERGRTWEELTEGYLTR